ncbi:hypothetical protein BDQ94DRAFT_145363 [Aspergillus welwitschiae]|uniref:Uncharacterized protein n=1 Tax=Aspergillus welwitschiae TaxID=1341132 RepID=A0A3F3Q0A9_9EURO|nr:hypothetical protein BDQ94DRAFT_145363 [Aspergillus welwitschiae]RDH32515.1 hypothetical protein BDQ94DRAFT_145363 [Aspergillus welwitschiae]
MSKSGDRFVTETPETRLRTEGVVWTEQEAKEMAEEFPCSRMASCWEAEGRRRKGWPDRGPGGAPAKARELLGRHGNWICSGRYRGDYGGM